MAKTTAKTEDPAHTGWITIHSESGTPSHKHTTIIQKLILDSGHNVVRMCVLDNVGNLNSCEVLWTALPTTTE